MARNDVYLNINALSPADAVVTGQQDMTAATVPELVLGDTPTFNFYFTDNTNVWPSWAGNAAYTVTWALSDAVSGDFSPAATTGNATPITGGWSVVLPLNAYDLVGLLNTKRVSQPYPVTNLWQQIRVADPSGNEVTRAMFWTPIRYRAISDTQNTESASPTGGREVTVDNVNVLTTPTAAQFYAANPVPTSALGSAANGELLIGNGTGFTKATLTAGDGVTITNASGSITIDASAAQEKLTATVKNAESTPITKGQVVYLFGATGNMASVKLAYNTSDATSAKTFGVVSSTSIAANGTGLVTCVGVVDGLNLGAYQDGDTLYLGATPGSVTATKPYAPNHLVYVGIVERANAGNGELYVKVQNGYELDEIHDVQINAPRQSGQTLIYDNTTSLWKNARITAGSNIAVTNGDGSITIGFSGTLPVANGGTGVTTSTGSGSVVLSTSPTLTTPILGTPQSGTLSSCTGLPISTGVSGLGTGVATFLATPSSANLASAVTDETGTGALVFANTPTLVTPNIGAATGTSVNLSGAGTFGGNLTVSGTGTSTFGTTNTVSLGAGSITATNSTAGAGPTFLIRNLDNTNASSAAIMQATVGGANAGDPRILLTVDAVQDWTIGVDNSDSDKFKIGRSSSVGTNTSFTIDTADNTTLAGNLTVSGTGTSSVAGKLFIAKTTPDSGNGVLQLATHTTSAGGIGFGNQMALYLTNPSDISLDALAGNPILRFRNTGTEQFRLESSGSQAYFTAANSIIMRPGGVTALTLDSSQNATFAGNITVNGAGPYTLKSRTIINRSDNTSATFGHVSLTRGTGAGTTAALATTGDASNGVASVSLQLSDADRFVVTSAGTVVLGTQASLATNATDGFTYIPVSAGAPTGTPTAYTGKVAMEYDTTNNKLYIYNGGWKSVTLA